MTFLSIIVFILIFSLLVIIHELGHFWAAKRAGVRVEEFGLGLPPRIWGKAHKGTLFSFNWIPFGGFVKLKGEGVEGDNDPDSMRVKSYGSRFLIIVGGVAMNLIGAYVLLCIGMWLGMPPLATQPQKLVGADVSVGSKVVVVEIQKDSPADRAGIIQGDYLVAIDGKSIETVTQLQTAIVGKKAVSVTIFRDEEEKTIAITTTKQNGVEIIGVGADELIASVEYPPVLVPVFAARDFANVVMQIGGAIGGFVGQLFTTGSLQEGVSGPIGIAKITGQAVNMGWMAVLQLMIFLSVNLGIINLFPFPALDGGRLVFLIAEIVTGGRKVSTLTEGIIHNSGFLLLLILIAVVTYRDLVNLF